MYTLMAAADDNRIKSVVTAASWLHDAEAVKLFYGGEDGVHRVSTHKHYRNADFHVFLKDNIAVAIEPPHVQGGIPVLGIESQVAAKVIAEGWAVNELVVGGKGILIEDDIVDGRGNAFATRSAA